MLKEVYFNPNTCVEAKQIRWRSRRVIFTIMGLLQNDDFCNPKEHSDGGYRQKGILRFTQNDYGTAFHNRP